MQHVKLTVFGVVLVVVAVFGFIFWDDLKFNQQELSNTALPPSPMADGVQQNPAENKAAAEAAGKDDSQAALSQGDDYDDLEKDLNSTSVDVDSDSADLQSGMSGL